MARTSTLLFVLFSIFNASQTFNYPDDELCGYFVAPPTARIFKGKAVVLGEFPWVVALRFHVGVVGKAKTCTGGILNERWLLTAGHCLDKYVMYCIN